MATSHHRGCAKRSGVGKQQQDADDLNGQTQLAGQTHHVVHKTDACYKDGTEQKPRITKTAQQFEQQRGDDENDAPAPEWSRGCASCVRSACR